jgi:hypothetical protein
MKINGTHPNGTYLSEKRNIYGIFSERGDSVRYDKWAICPDSRPHRKDSRDSKISDIGKYLP